ncbi:MAG: GNAT family N-acetyltransferase [Enterobacteriaceae bacterium]|jgi:GNAT superfamily N-acetyltransferase|nr:GNAT family N-acetyltransferase [Enterobacteriaceae bacterium]
MTLFSSAISDHAVQIRSYQPGDGKLISQLFRAVYGHSYVYPDIYLPRLIEAYLASGKWYSALAFYQGRLVGHASLVKETERQDQAEFALVAVSPEFQGKGIARSLGHTLCHYAKQQQYRLLTVKQVCSHQKSQHLAQSLGFYSTALMLDYVDSPFGLPEPESIVQGILPLQAFPLPKLNWPQPWQNWAIQIGQRVGEFTAGGQQGDDTPCSSNTLLSKQDSARQASTRQCSSKINGRRLEITAYEIDPEFVAEVIDYPASQLIYLKLPACEQALKLYPQLKKGGFRFAGLCPDAHEGWFLLWLRGYQSTRYEFCDLNTQNLYQMELGNTREYTFQPWANATIPPVSY